MTEKLYDANPRLMHFEAIVLACENEKKGFSIILDKTAFFPEEGGQYADLGALNGVPVLNVKIKNGVIRHFINEALAPGSYIEGQVDWTNRFDKMQQHSGEHILSGLIHRSYSYNNVGFHLGNEEVTLDFNGVLSMEDIDRLETEANDAVFKNIDVTASFPEKDLLSAIQYRSKIEIDGPVRIVEIPGYDVCACCAPHVEKTGEIGLIKITGLQNYKGGSRLNILCGHRAMLDYRFKLNSVQALSAKLSTKPALVEAAVTRLEQELAASKERLIHFQQTLLQTQIAQLPKDAANIVLFETDLDAPAVRKAVNLLSEQHAGYSCIFTGNDETGYSYMIGSKSLDCRQPAQLLREQLQAKGGGSALMVQGSLCAAKHRIIEILDF